MLLSQSLPLTLLITILLLSPSSQAADASTTEQQSTTELDTVTVSAHEQEIRTVEIDEGGFNVDKIDTSEFFNFSKDLQQILNTAPGIIVRQKGALGADSEVSVNGLSGKQIRYFLDGIPMESFGSALRLGDLPVNIVNGIDVYKGVVPIYLSADALGGAINIKTPDIRDNFFNGSASYGSFNTQRASFNSQHLTANQHYFVRLTGFFNHSDNDYEMHQVPAVDKFGNVDGVKKARRFHDAYTSRMLSVKAGIANQVWADELSLNLTGANNVNEVQHPETTINQVLGKYHSRNKTHLASLTYKLNSEHFSVKSYLLSGQAKESYIDTAARRYQWDGSFTERSGPVGELSGKSKLTVTDSLFKANISSRYHISDLTSIGFSASHDKLSRSGKDPINTESELYKRDNKINKSVLAVDIASNFIDGNLTTNFFVKNYHFQATVNNQQEVDGKNTNVTTKPTTRNTGAGIALQFPLFKDINGKFSYEHAFRLPEADEILGNGQFVLANPLLKPEESDNFNIGLFHQVQAGKLFNNSEVNYFYRNSENFIHYFASQVIRGKYINLNKIRVSGTELSTAFDYDNTYSFKINLTYQDITERTRHDAEGVKNVNFGNRIPNTPYLFASARMGWNNHLDNFDRFSTYLSSNFVEEYFLNWEGSGDKKSKNKIPRQHTYDLDLEYVFSRVDISTTFTITNISNKTVFDNFNIQKPGRAYYLKFRYSY